MRTGPSDWITLRTHASDPQVEGYWHFRNPLEQDRLVFEYDGTDATSDDVLTLWNNGKVSVGSATIGADPAYRLYVEGGIVARDVRVTIQPFPDYVFKSDYPLRPLPDLAAYLHTHQHLPGMPSATEVEAEGGAELGDLFARLLRTVEEQTLYILQLEQRLADLERCAKPPER
ncbi:MAG: hypothetical protein IPH53_04410 [Flavobacteriales bacterium]|nr:hypothetical protein [Flavobacteriales bacterium]